MTDRPGKERASGPPERGSTVRREADAAHTRRHKLLRIGGLTVAGLVLATVGAGLLFYEHLNGNLSIFSGAGIASSRPPVGPGDGSGSVPVNILLLGSDSRAAGNDNLAGGDIGPGNSDTAIVVHVYADHRHAVAVSIPRDSLVDIPPCLLPNGKWTAPQHGQMFNTAFSVGASPSGNPACTQNTVEAMTGLRVNHTIVIDFKGFATMTSAVGGVPVCVPNDVSGFGIHLKKGRQVVSGQNALDYVRARHGIGDGSDIGRIKRQQAFLAALTRKIQDQGFDLTTLLPLADAATKSLTVDPDLGTAMKLAVFVQSMRSIKLADVSFVTAPWRYAGERVALVHPDVDTLWTLLRQDRTLDGQSTGQVTDPPSAAPAAASPADPTVAVTVLNGTQTPGLSLVGVRQLRAQGYQNVVSSTEGTDHALTTVGYTAGHRADAEQLARHFPGAELSATAEAATPLTVTLGADYAASAAPSATTEASDAFGSSPASSAASAADAGSAAASATASPTGLPSGIAQNTRPGTADPCAGLVY
ncbi:transcriptional regulator [Streptomyces tateyamensis]|uniref:Transcriptional regulator n=1 Tax=Streptomyces tateyamensis TaxID=565073 RepID=A0A2V4N0G2_9ACTN|nr:LCP family protein [Streptomyces tateyamensis]PYC73883.1 transcriptional regulator [Streptomyces tateyamensis]